MNLSIYANNDKKLLDKVASTIYALKQDEYTVIVSDEENIPPSLYIPTTNIIEPILKVNIPKDGLTVRISLYPGINTEKSIGATQISDFLKTSGVLDEYIHEDKVIEAAKLFAQKLIIIDFLVGEGVPAVNGENAIIERLFENVGRISVVNNPRSNVDYKAINSFILVDKDDVILRRRPPTAGSNGSTVKGDTIFAIAGEDKTIDVGEGVIVNENKTEYLAKFNGHLTMSGSQISVLPVLEIKGNVDLRVGNVTFDGTVYVTGDVLPGFSIKADNIIVDGIVENAELISKSDILVKIGRKGVGKGLIKADGDIVIGYCENAEIFAGGNVEIIKYCFNSRVSGEKIITSSKDSVINGGFLQAFSEIRSANLGSNSTNDMTVFVGISPKISAQAEKVMAEIHNINSSLQKISDIVKKIDMINVDSLKDEKFRKLIDTSILFKRRLPLLQKKYDELMLKATCKNPKIVVENRARPGVKIKIHNALITLKNEMKRTEFFYDEETVEVGFKNI